MEPTGRNGSSGAGMTEIRLEGDSKRLFTELESRGDGMTKVFRVFSRYMGVMTDNMFKKNARGGVWRGVTWKYFAPQYTRKDGTVIPAWGGVAKVRGEGNVLGRKRPSGARIQKGDSVVQDTGTLRNNATLGVAHITKTKMRIGTNINYAAAQQKMRPFLFFTKRDAAYLNKLMSDYLMTGKLPGNAK